MEVVSKMLGHTNTRMTAHYAKLVDESIAKQMDQLTDIFNEQDSAERVTQIYLDSFGNDQMDDAMKNLL